MKKNVAILLFNTLYGFIMASISKNIHMGFGHERNTDYLKGE